MEKKKRKTGAGDILLLFFSVVYLVGVLSIFAPCGPKEDGSWMTCHWAGQAVAGLAAVLVLIALAHLFLADAKIKIGLDIAAVPVSLLATLLPGGLIHLCMMHTMRCRSVMRPAAAVMSGLVIGTAIYDALKQRGRG